MHTTQPNQNIIHQNMLMTATVVNLQTFSIDRATLQTLLETTLFLWRLFISVHAPLLTAPGLSPLVALCADSVWRAEQSLIH